MARHTRGLICGLSPQWRAVFWIVYVSPHVTCCAAQQIHYCVCSLLCCITWDKASSQRGKRFSPRRNFLLPCFGMYPFPLPSFAVIGKKARHAVVVVFSFFLSSNKTCHYVQEKTGFQRWAFSPADHLTSLFIYCGSSSQLLCGTAYAVEQCRGGEIKTTNKALLCNTEKLSVNSWTKYWHLSETGFQVK